MDDFQNESDPVNAKPYRLTFEQRPAYLYIHIISDQISYDIARQYWDEVFALRDHTKAELMLIDKDIPAELTFADALQMASEVAVWEHHNVKLALCDRHATQKAIQFGEMVATNRGLNTRSFSDFGEAEEWLLSD